MNDKLQKLYNTLRNDYGENFNVDYDTFVNDMRDKEKRARLYDTMRNDYGEKFNRSFDEFSSDIGVDAPMHLQRPTGHYPSPEPPEPAVALSEQEEHHDEADAASAFPLLSAPAPPEVQNPFETMNTGIALNERKKSFDDIATENYSRYRTENLFKSHLKRQLEETKERVAADYEKEYNKEAGEKFKKDKEVGFFKSALRNLASARMIPVPHEDMPKSGNYSVATHFIEDANRVLRESEKKGDSAWKKIGRGVSDALLDTDTWSMGVLEFDRNNRIANAVKKYEEGKTLSESETQMLDALALNLAVHQYYGSDISRQYKWGQIAGQSAPFMVEMLLNPISGAGKGLAKQLAKYGIKRFAATGGKKLAIKAGARTLGDIGAAFGMVATSGMPRTAADAVQRMTGEGTFDIDDDGNVKYTGHEKGLNAPQAIYKAIVGQAIEYQSEMLGSSGVGTLLKKIPGLNILSKKIKATGFGRFMGKMHNSPTYKTLKKYEQRAQWSGSFPEYFEEAYGTGANALFVGDNKLSDLVDLDEQVDTFMGLALTGGAMSALNTGGYTIDRARVGQRLRVADKAAGELFGNWAQQKALLGDMSVGERTASIAATLRRNDITNEAKKAYMDYATSLTFKESMTGAAAEAMKLSDKSAETKKRVADEAVHPLVDEDADLTSSDVHAGAMYTTKKAQEVLDEVFENSEYDGIDFEEIPNLPEAEQREAIERILNEEGLSDEQKHAVLDYVRARNLEYTLQRKRNSLYSKWAQESVEQIDQRVNKKTGTLVSARIKGSEGTVYITDGLALKEDAEGGGGFVPDGERSDDTVYYLDTDDNVKPTTADDLEIVNNEDAQANIDEVQRLYASLHATQQQEIEKRFNEMIAEESRVITPSPPATADERTSQPLEEEVTVPANKHVENNPVNTEVDMADNPYANATEEQLQEALDHLKKAIESGILSPEQEVANFDEQEKIANELAARQQSHNEINTEPDFGAGDRGTMPDGRTVEIINVKPNGLYQLEITDGQGNTADVAVPASDLSAYGFGLNEASDVLDETNSKVAAIDKKIKELKEEQNNESNLSWRHRLYNSPYYAYRDGIDEPDSPYKGKTEEELEEQFNKEIEFLNAILGHLRKKGASNDEIFRRLTAIMFKAGSVTRFVGDSLWLKGFLEEGRTTFKSGSEVQKEYNAKIAELEKQKEVSPKSESIEYVDDHTPQKDEEEVVEKTDFPRDKSGEIDYSKITDDAQYVAALHEDFKDSPEEIPAILQEYQQMAEKNVAKAKRISDPVKRRKAIAKAQAEVNRFASMHEQTRPKAQMPKYERRDTLVNGNNRQREAQLGDFVSLRDYLLRGIGAGRFKFLWNDKGPKRGLRNEILSSKHTEDERRKRISFLDNNGFTPETLAHYIWDNRGADIPESWSDDVQVTRDEINDILLSYDTPTAMIDAAIELHDKYEQLEDYYGDTVSPDEIANFDANDASQNELLLSLPVEGLPDDISEYELNEYYGQDKRIENIGTTNAAGSRERNDGGTGIGGESPDQTARDGGAAHAQRETGEQSARNSIEEPDAQRAGYDHEGNYSTPHQSFEETGNSDTGRDIRTTGEVEPSALHTRESGGLSDNRSGDAATGGTYESEAAGSVGGDERAIQAGISGTDETDSRTIRGGRESDARARQSERLIVDIRDGIQNKSKQEQLEFIAQYAKENGYWIEDTDELGNYYDEGGENEVYRSGKEPSVNKVNNFEYAGDDITHFFDRIEDHNILFGNAPYTLIGFTENTKGEVSAILQQPLIDTEREATEQEIVEHMVSMGFEADGTDSFENEQYLVFDAVPNNVLVGKDGQLYFIDTQIRRNKIDKSQDIGHTQSETDRSPKDIVSLAEKQVKNNEIELAVEALAKRFNTPITIYRSKEEIPKLEKDKHYHQKLQAKGWFDMKADTVFINTFNAESVEDARSTVFHELVAHKGILDMLGKEKHKELLESIFEMMPKEAQERYLSAYGSEYIAADEYIAYLAENEANLSPREQGIWNQIKQAIIDFIERHLNIELSRENVDDVINALLVASRERLEHKSDNRDEKRDPTKELKGTKGSKIDDFGEKIGGARKDIWAEYVSKLKNVSNEQLQSNPLSKTFKRPDFAALVTDGKLTQNQALFLSFMYENIPNKPRKRVFVGGWVKLVREVMDSLEDAIANGQNSRINDEVIERFVAQARPFTKDAELKTYMDVQKAAGFPNQIVQLDGFSIKKFSGRDGYTVVQKHRIIKDTNTYEEAVQAIADILTDESKGSTTKRKKVDIAVYQNRRTKEIFIGKVLQGKEPYVLKKGFETVNEAHAYLRENREALEAQWEKINKPVKERRDKNRTRSGKDWRGGRDIAPEEYSDAFGFRGVEFGNWVNNKERQKALNDSYDAFMDLSELIGVSPRALSLNGELAIAFGARGKGSVGGTKAAAAHYERGKVVINLTKNRGAGSLAHEWFHALDNYFGRRRGKKEEYITNFPHKLGYNGAEDVTRQEVLDAFNGLVKTLKASDLYKRSKQLDSVRSNDYWSTVIEMAARAFEHYVIEKATDSGLRNDYLANLSTIGEWIEESFDIDSYPYPTKEETPVMRDAFDNLFETIQEKVDEETGNAVLFRMNGEKTRKTQIGRNKYLHEEWYDNGQQRTKIIYKNGKLHGLFEQWYENGKQEYKINYKEGQTQGLYESWYENGQPKIKATYRNGEYNGLYSEWHNNGQIFQKSNYKKGKLEGSYEEWHDNGQQWKKSTYKNNKLNGIYEEWDYEGQMKSQIHYKEGELHGTYKTWYNNGQLIIETSYNNGEVDGNYKSWYINGKPEKHVYYNNGKIEGEYKRWYDNGQLLEQAFYKDGVKHGKEETRHINGQLESQANYTNGKVEGVFKRWYDNGQLKEQVDYTHGVQQGQYKSWYIDGQPATEAFYNNGKIEGEYKQWYDNGQLSKQTSYKDGKRDGIEKRWHPNGVLKQRTHYLNDRRDGAYEAWNVSGQLIEKSHYKGDLLDGQYEAWHNNGQLKVKQFYKLGHRDGLYERFRENGQPEERINYIEETQNGIHDKWDEEGTHILHANFKMGKLHGVYESRHPNGKLKEQSNYIDGELNGKSERWHDNGNLTKKAFYKAGRLDGVYQEWSEENNKPIIYAEYDNGNLVGTYTEWDNKGDKLIDLNIENGDGFFLWHGSPHEFTAFSLNKIGSGEGVQAFGHGLYFTNVFSIARGYAKKLGRYAGNRNIYRVEVKKDGDLNFLDWDEVPNENITSLLKESYPLRGYELGTKSGSEIYNILSSNLGGADKASELLLAEGVAGIRYPANYVTGSKRTAGEYNYVMFDDKLIEVNEHVRFRDGTAQLKAKSIANDTFMKAPNGKPTNLTERQWLHVRTPEFKNWFGDWEKATRIEKLIKSEPIEISGKEVPASDDLKMYKKNAFEYGKHLRGKYVNKDTGSTIFLGKNALIEVLQHDYKNIEQLQSVAAIPQIMEQAIYIETVHNNDTKVNSDTFDYYVSGLKINGVDYTVRSVIVTLKDGTRYYDHKLTRIEKGKLIDSLIGTNPGFSQKETLISDVKDTKLVSILQNNSSKVVDENGEPLVVFHGTNKLFDSFAMQEGALGRGAYFSSAFTEAADYAAEKLGEELSDDNDYGGDWAGSYIKEVFLNIRDDNNIAHSQYGDAMIYLASEPNQIKSATDNVGTYDSANDDIRFRVESESGSEDFRDESISKEQALYESQFDDLKEKHFRLEIELDKLRRKVKNHEMGLGEFAMERAKLTPQMDALTKQMDAIKKKMAEVTSAAEKRGARSTYSDDTTRFAELKGMFADEQLGDKRVPTPPRLTAKQSVSDVAFAVTTFHKQTGEILQKVEEEMANISSTFTEFVDRARPLEKLLVLMHEHGATLTDDMDAYSNFITSTSRGTHLIQEYNMSRIKPLQETLHDVIASGKLKGLPTYRWHIVDEVTGKELNTAEITNYERVSLYLQAKDIVEADGMKGVASRGGKGFEKNVRTSDGLQGIKPEEYIAEFEQAVGQETIDLIWEQVRAINKWALDLQLEYGVITRDVYEEYTTGGRKYYVPQRGWRERDMDGRDRYYVPGIEISPDNPYNSALVKARGRTTLAGDPLAYMQSIGESTVMFVMKNHTKQVFLAFAEANADFARHHNIFALGNVFYVNTGRHDENGDAIFERSYEEPSPEQLENDKEVRGLLKELEASREQARSRLKAGKMTQRQYDVFMEKLEAREKRLRNNIHVLYQGSEAQSISQVTKKERAQHTVTVLRDGKEYDIIFSDRYSGERVANVLNRNFSPETAFDTKWYYEHMREYTRFMSAMMTQYNPSFAVANAIRDLNMATVSNLSEFGVGYTAEFHKNLFKVQRAVWKYAAGEQFDNSNKYTDGYYGHLLHEFFEDGAATGWSFLKDIDQLRKDMNRAIDPTAKDLVMHGTFGVYNAFGVKQVFGMLTEVSELTTRFAEYVTSREQKNADGTAKYTRQQAAIHAKEVTVNFDRKGTQKGFGMLYAFFNASIQGTNKLFRMIRDPRVRRNLISICSVYVVGGALQAMFMPDPYDEEERIWTEWELMNNLCFGKMKMPLAQGLRAFWGIGAQIGLAMRGKKSVEHSLMDGTTYFVGELVPEQLTFLLNGMDIDEKTGRFDYNAILAGRGVVPTTIQPIYDVVMNTNFMGGTSYRTEFTNALQGTKAKRTLGKRNVSEGAQAVSDLLWRAGGGETTHSGRYRKGDTRVVSWIWDWNPSAIETLVRGYSAGTGKFVFDMYTLSTQLLDPDKKVDVSTMAIANVLYKQPREYTTLDNKKRVLSKKIGFHKVQFSEMKKNAPQAYREMVDFHINNATLLQRDPHGFDTRIERYGTKRNRLFRTVQRAELLEKQMAAGMVSGAIAEREVDMLLDAFERLE